MIDPTLAVTALGLGLAGSGHCLGMCGGIAVAFGMGGRSPGSVAWYHAGRVSSYTLLGLAAGLLGSLSDSAGVTIFLRYLAGALLIGMGLYVARWWMGMSLLERAGAALFRPIQRRLSRSIANTRASGRFLLGLGWGVMPCGLIYSSLAWATTTQHALTSGALMLLFGMGTLPAMLAVGMGANRVQQLLRSYALKQAIGCALIVCGIWTLYTAASHGDHAAHATHAEHAGHTTH